MFRYLAMYVNILKNANKHTQNANKHTQNANKHTQNVNKHIQNADKVTFLRTCINNQLGMMNPYIPRLIVYETLLRLCLFLGIFAALRFGR